MPAVNRVKRWYARLRPEGAGQSPPLAGETAAPPGSSRPPIRERREYIPVGPPEEFIVPLLKAEITSVLSSLPSSCPHFKVLDVGCGGQPFRSLIESKGLGYLSTDIQDAYNIVDFIAEVDGDLPAALTKAGPFDFVLCAEVLEHVADWDKTFSNLALLLRPGGRALVTCPFFYFLHEQPYDFWRPTPHALEYYARRHGLRVSLKQAGGSWDVLGTLLGINLATAWPSTDRLTDRLLAGTVNVASRILLRVIKTTLKERVFWGNSDYPVYLSNIAILERPAVISDTSRNA